jgi:hypothetical protein
MLEVFGEAPARPPWIGIRTWIKARMKAWRAARRPIEMAPWGSAGPDALTWCLKSEKLVHLAQPSDVLYPVHWSKVEILARRSTPVEAYVRPMTRSVHLYHHMLKWYNIVPEPGSFLDRVEEEGRGGAPAFK